MKRSRTARLLLMGMSPLVISACNAPSNNSSQDWSDGSSESAEQRFYDSPLSCAQSGENSLQDCKSAYDKASAEHERSAPRFTSAEACGNEYGAGQCREANDGSGSFMPFMAGMLLARAFNGGGNTMRPMYRQPRCEERFGAANCRSGGSGYAGGGGVYPRGYQPGPPVQSNLNLPAPTRSIASTRSRSGFGSGGHYYGG